MLEVFYWCAGGLLLWRAMQILGTFAGLGATEIGLGLPPEMLAVQLDQSVVPNGGACGVRPVSILVPFAQSDAAEDLALTLNALNQIDLPRVEVLVLTDLEDPRQLPLQGFRYEFSLDKSMPLHEARLAAPVVAWEARVRFDTKLRVLGIGAEGAQRGSQSWRVSALNAGINASRFPMVLWHPPGIELESRALARMSMAILARPDIAGVAATTVHRLPNRTPIAAALSNLRVVRRSRLKTSWLGPFASLPTGPAMWRRDAVVAAGGFRADPGELHDLLASLETRLRALPSEGSALRTVSVLGAEARRFESVHPSKLVVEESLLLAARPRWTLASSTSWRDLWRYLVVLATDRLQPALEAVMLLAAIALAAMAALGTEVWGSAPTSTVVATRAVIVAVSLLVMVPLAVDLFVVLADQLRFRRWSGRELGLMVLACGLHATIIRQMVAFCVWPQVLRGWLRRSDARSMATLQPRESTPHSG